MRSFFYIILIVLASLPGLSQYDVPAFVHGYQRVKIDSLNALSEKILLKNPEQSRELAKTALLHARQIEYQQGIGESFKNIGNSYWAQSNYPVCLYYLNTAVSYLKDDSSNLAKCYSTMARANSDSHNFLAADSLFSKATQFAGERKKILCIISTEKSAMYRSQKKFDQSFEEAQKALTMAVMLHDERNIAILYSRIFSLFVDKKQYSVASKWLDTALILSVRNQNNRLTACNCIIGSHLQMVQKNYDKAIPMAEKGLQLANSIGAIELASNASYILYKTYEAKDDPILTLTYYKKYQQFHDTLNARNNRKSFQILKENAASNEDLEIIDELQDIIAHNGFVFAAQRNVIFLLATLMVLLIGLLAIGMYYYKRKKQLNHQLQKTNDEILDQKEIISQQAENLKQLNSSKDRIMGILGHDLRTPVMNLRSLVTLANEDIISQKEFQELLKTLVPALNAAELTLNNLMKWSDSQKTTSKIVSLPVDLLQILQEVETIFQYPLEQKNLQLIYEINTTGKAIADENHLKAILHNLVSNAIKFTPFNGLIRLSVYTKDEKLFVEVQDTGMGMKKEVVDNLFNLNGGFTTRGTNGENGTGMGLQLCHELATRNAGEIWASSTLGQGTTFYLSLPLSLN